MKWFSILTILFSLKTIYAIKILAVFGLPGRSNSFLGHALVKLLAEAGHEITYITPRPPAKEIPGVKIIDVSNVVEHYNPDEYANLKDILNNIPEVDKTIPLRKMVMDLSQILVENPNVQELLADVNQNFELVISEWSFNELLAGFAAVYNCPYIWFSTVIPHWMILELVDDSTNPSYNTDFLSRNISPFTFIQRVNELLFQIWGHFAQFYMSSMENTLYEKLFAKFILNRGHNLPSWKDVKYNASLVLSNSHISFTMPERLPQNVIPIGGFHINSTPPTLTEDLKNIMDSAPNGIIYFSLGSNFKSKHLPDTMKRELLETFGKLKQTVIWKFEEDLPNLPSNVHILNWASQHSILAHKNCILLITHGGLLSMTETVHYGVPVIGIPVRGDQFLNINIAAYKGYAVKVDFSYNLAKDLDGALKEILNEPRYSIKAKEASIIYHHRTVPPAKELVHWVELVAKTKGASHLRSHALTLPWYQKYYIDLAAVIIGLILAIYYVIRRVENKFFGKIKND